ncbi:MAG: hypothetical protein JNL21_02840 [Myxococcales bacterium]|nr:hypothetical protein [Myxococcales bacterium]
MILVAGVAASACGDDATGTGGSDGSGAGTTTASTGGAGGAPPTGEIVASITRYDLQVDLAAKAARSTLAVEVEPPGGDCFSAPSELPATAARFDGTDLDPSGISHDGAALRVCGPGLSPGPHTIGADVALVSQTFHGLDVGLSETPDFAGNTFSYLLSWVGGCDHFGPCDDDPSRLAHFTIEIDHAPGAVALCPGTLVAGSTTTRCELTGTPAPTYSAYAAMTNPGWVRTPFVTAAGVEVVFYEAAGGTIAASLDSVSVSDFLDWITTTLGPMPYGDELRVAGAPTVWLGFEHPANIVLYEEIGEIETSYQDTAMHVFMHEVIHQWAGNRTTLASAQDFAWKEAIAEYLAFVFERDARPAGEAEASLAYWDDISLQAAYHVRPEDEPPPPVDEFYGDVYGPGPMLLFVQLEPLIGADKVLAGIARFLQDGGAASVEALQAALEAESGADLQPYFDAWVFGSGAPSYPSFTVSTADAGGGMLTVTVTQAQGGAPLPCVVEVDVAGATSTATAVVDFGLDPSMTEVSVTIPFAEAVVSTSVDPRHKVVDAPVGLDLVSRPRRMVWKF